ncbi:hypothetical protein EXIGLDRAFT_342209 [Exidia glandulosa HHB12029]|uniref:Uncharacterized protein n=1 Tax=Exidia glandulosa HHB12029 TaxID=1314781 RepID=A0A165LGZ8_EXIGL|nr:hypothetical protein EXIGLDRAFT_342209 [Exidia glandulosa HHB12029]
MVRGPWWIVGLVGQLSAPAGTARVQISGRYGARIQLAGPAGDGSVGYGPVSRQDFGDSRASNTLVRHSECSLQCTSASGRTQRFLPAIDEPMSPLLSGLARNVLRHDLVLILDALDGSGTYRILQSTYGHCRHPYDARPFPLAHVEVNCTPWSGSSYRQLVRYDGLQPTQLPCHIGR